MEKHNKIYFCLIFTLIGILVSVWIWKASQEDPNHATMPDDLIYLLASQMQEGDSAWISLYDVHIDKNKKIWIEKDSNLFENIDWLKPAKKPVVHIKRGYGNLVNYFEVSVSRERLGERKWESRSWAGPKKCFKVSKFVIVE